MAITALIPGPLAQHPFLTAAALVIVPIISIILHDAYLWWRLPPGPIPWPFIGNKHIIPKKGPHIQFQQWSYKYGPIYTLWLGRQPTVIISDPVVAVDLLEKRSNKYSSRPRMIAMSEIYSRKNSILVQPYGKEWSIRRKLMHYALTPKALSLYKPTQEAEATRLCFQLLHTPDNYEKLIERFTSSIVFCVAYGHRIDSLKAKVILARFKSMHFQAQLLVLGKYMVDSIPALMYLPSFLAPWKKEIAEKGLEEGASNRALLDVVKADMQRAVDSGDEKATTVPDSLSKLLLELRERENVPLNETEMSYIPGSLFGAGSDTTASTLCSAVLALVTHPAALQRAQRELDAVVGTHRSPTFSDEASLPYLRALVKEVLRWRPVAVLGGTPRSTTEADLYNGYYLPKGTSVLTNAWAVNHNEAYYPDSHRFEPARFLPITKSASTALEAGDEKAIAELKPSKAFPGKSGENVFGVGRRVCPGANLAENSLFAALAKMIWAFDFGPSEGVAYDTFAYTEGINIRPRPFRCSIKIRSEEHRRVIEREEEGAEEWLSRFTPFAE